MSVAAESISWWLVPVPGAVCAAIMWRRPIFVNWTASLEAAADSNSLFKPLRIVRLKHGFSLAIRPDVEFRVSALLRGYYAPVIEVTQVIPDGRQAEERFAGS